MSRIGLKPIVIPDKVTIELKDKTFYVTGPNGNLTFDLPEHIDYKLEDKTLSFSRANDLKHVRGLHGLTRALASNAINGVATGFTKILQFEGVGYKAELRGTRLLLSLGFSHPVLVIPPDGIKFEFTPPNTIKISGIDRQLIGAVAAKIRSLRKPEPYKGKGLRYQGEYIRRKAGKTASK
ncbi:MAG: 50S ribosomal protein L6 [Candidatus Kapabacteria bacterium]|nr:50S ribosomal protein L6 [Candidatus Kapabacteria bacterium]